MDVLVFEVAMADAPFQARLRRFVHMRTKPGGQSLEITPIFGSMTQKRTKRRERSIDEIIQIQLEAGLLTHKVLGRDVNRRRYLPDKAAILQVVPGQGLPLGVTEKHHMPKPLGCR